MPHADDYAGIVVFGGPQSANDPCSRLQAELAWIRGALQADRRLLGICLGAQLMAKALGATVSPHPQGHVECGYAWVDPTDAPWLDAPLPVYHWHEEGFTLPPGAQLWAQGRGPFPVQGFAWGRSLGMQFHPEAVDSILEAWLTREGHLLTRPGAHPPEAHWADHAAHQTHQDTWVFQLLDHWLGIPTL